MSAHQVFSIYSVSPEKRPLRKNRLGAPDVYPQDAKQEEDIMSAERLRKGFIVQVPQCEHESLVFNTKNPRSIDDAVNRAAKFVMAVMQQKDENNKFHMDRKKLKECTFIGFTAQNAQKEKGNWYDDLARGKSLANLAKKLPNLRRDGLDVLFQAKVPIPRAIWCLKMNQIGNMLQQAQQNKTKRQLDNIKIVASYVKTMLRKVFQRWPYYSCLFKNCFEEGILDRQDFLFELCDQLTEYMNFPLERPDVFRLLITFTTHFVDFAAQNVFIARRLAWICCVRLAKYKTDYEKKFGSTEVSETFADLEACKSHHNVIMNMLGVLKALLVDCPAAFVWNPADCKHGAPDQLAGSPLDQFPDVEYILTKHYPEAAKRFADIIRLRLQEVRQRSRNVENRWALANGNQVGFDKVVNICIKVVSALDLVDVTRPKAFQTLYEEVFGKLQTGSSDFQIEMIIRLKLCMTWAVTSEREGTHRALIVAKLFQLRVLYAAKKQCEPFGGFRLQDVLVDFISHDTPAIDSPVYRKEYGNLIHLFLELQRAKLFDHDQYVRSLLRCGMLTTPIMQKVAEANPPTNQSPSKSVEMEDRERHPSTPNKPQPQQDQGGIISFIPPVENSPIPVLQKTKDESPRWKERPGSADVCLEEAEGKDELCALHADPPAADEHDLLTEPAALTVHERFLLQLPIEQVEANRDQRNQRLTVVYGRSADGDAAKQRLHQVAADVARIWQKKHCYQFRVGTTEFAHKLRLRTDDCTDFRRLTFYDQLVVAGRCADLFMDAVYEFVDRKTAHIPTAEGLEVLCAMFEECRHVAGIVDLALELIPLLDEVETYLDSFESEYMPGFIAGQMAYVLCSYLAAHINYFLCHKDAVKVVNSLTRTFSQALRGSGYPLTGWSRAVLAFVWNVRLQLVSAGVHPEPMPGRAEDFRRNFHEAVPRAAPDNLRYNPEFFMDMLDSVRRVLHYDLYKRHLPSIEDDHSRFSFACNAFKKVIENRNDIDRIGELANLCGHVSAQKHMAQTWYSAVLDLCFPAANKTKPLLIKETGVDVEDTTQHYALSLFVMLLASRYCFSTHVLVNMLVYRVLAPVINDDSSAHRAALNNTGGLCLTLRILSGLVCASDEPFKIKAEEAQRTRVLGHVRAIRLLQVNELDKAVFPLLSAVSILNEALKALPEKPEKARLLAMARYALLAMCEEEWVIRRVFWICEADEKGDADQKSRKEDPFNCQRLKNNSVGQNLLRIALRRRSERRVKQELMVCKSNSRKSLLEKLFTTMNLWNFRATFFDLKLIIKENSPDSLSKHVQQHAMHAEILNQEVARCCGELFGRCQQDWRQLQPPPLGALRFDRINCYWLIAPLIRQCPQPENIPSNFVNCSVKGKFLKDTAMRLESIKREQLDDAKGRYQQKSAWFLNQQPFVNLILACLDGEEQQGDGLAAALLKQLQDLVQRVKDNPTLPHSQAFVPERSELLLRLNLLGGMFDSLAQSTADQWALVLFQLLYYNIISGDKERDHFDACFDMLSMLVHDALCDNAAGDADRRSDALRCRTPAYNTVVKKVRKELGERAIPADLFCLQQLLPIPRRKLADNSAWDMFGHQNVQKTKGSPENKVNYTRVAEPNYAPLAVRMDRFPAVQQRSIIRLLQHTHFNDYKQPHIYIARNDKKPLDVFLQPPETEQDPHEPIHAPPPPPPQQQVQMPPQHYAAMPPNPMQVAQQQQQQQQLSQQAGAPPMMQAAGFMGAQAPPAAAHMPPPAQPPPHAGLPPMPMGGMGMQGLPPGQLGLPQPDFRPGLAYQLPGQMGAQRLPMGMPGQPPPQMAADAAMPPVGAGGGGRGGRRKNTTPTTGRGTKRKSKTNLIEAQPPPLNPALLDPQQPQPQAPQHPSTANFPHAQPTHHIQQQMLQQQQQQYNQQQWQQMQQMRLNQQRMQQQQQQQQQQVGQMPQQMPPQAQAAPHGMQSDTKHRLQDAILKRNQHQHMHQPPR